MMDESIEAKLGGILRTRGLKLATAESCTGGLIGDRITNIPGSSDYYLGGVVSYAYEAKVKLLGVSWDTLQRYGAVSQETVLEMARGARLVLQADVGLAVSGIAGPGGGLPNKPVGTTWIGLSTACDEKAWRYLFPGDRLQIKEQASSRALQLLADYLSAACQEEVARLPQETPVEVKVRFDAQGQPHPQEFEWNGTSHLIASSGRRWEDTVGQHVLVMDYQDQIYELVFIPSSGRWFLKDSGLRSGKALSS